MARWNRVDCVCVTQCQHAARNGGDAVRYKMGIGMVPLTMVFASCSYFSGADACVVDESERPATVVDRA